MSVTFDPMVTISLPIPEKKEVKEFFFLPFHIKNGYVNNSFRIKVGESDNLRTLRTIMSDTYGINPGSYVIAAVYNNEFIKLHTTSANLLEVADEQGVTILYEIDPALEPSLPDKAMRQDSMYNVSPDVTILQLNLAVWTQDKHSNEDTKMQHLPRLLWVNKSQTLKELHLTIFKHLRHVFAEWADWSDPNSTRESRGKVNLRDIIPFPYRLGGSDVAQMTRAQFEALSDEEAFTLCCQGLIEGQCDGNVQSLSNFDIEKMPYQIMMKNTAGLYSTCKLCAKQQCRGCLMPYNSTETVAD